MPRRFFLNILVALFPCFMWAQSLPKPDKDYLYTEFSSVRKLKYIKKPIVSSGYIAMNGKEDFIYRQETPTLLEIKKIGDAAFYKKANIDPIQIDLSKSNFDESYSVIFLFYGDDKTVGEYFDITKTFADNLDNYKILPKKQGTIKLISATGLGDKLHSIDMIYADGSTLSYKFSNSVTGTKPDEKYFK